MDTLGIHPFLFWRLFCIECVYIKVLLDCPLLRGLSSFGVSFIRGSTVSQMGGFHIIRESKSVVDHSLRGTFKLCIEGVPHRVDKESRTHRIILLAG